MFRTACCAETTASLSHALAPLSLHAPYANQAARHTCIHCYFQRRSIASIVIYTHARASSSLREVQVGKLAQAAHRLSDLAPLLERDLHDHPRSHMMEHIVEHSTQFVHNIIFRAIGGKHTIVRAFALALLLIFAGMVEACGTSMRLQRASVRMLHTHEDSTSASVTHMHTRTHKQYKDEYNKAAFDPVLVHRITEDPSVPAPYEFELRF